jgi:hypothetical protein
MKIPIKRTYQTPQYVLAIALCVYIFTQFSACSPHNKEVIRDDGEKWIYLNGLHYDCDNLMISIDFPENWKDRFIIMEHERSLNVCLREAKENEPDLNVGTTLFTIISVDKDDTTANAWAETVGGTYFGENENKKVYLNVDGEIIPSLVNNLEDYSDMGIMSANMENQAAQIEKKEAFKGIVEKMITNKKRKGVKK